MMKPVDKRFLILVTVLLLLCYYGRICNKVNVVKERVKTETNEIFDKGFCTSGGDRDDCRVPLIEPWELISVHTKDVVTRFHGVRHTDYFEYEFTVEGVKYNGGNIQDENERRLIFRTD